MRLLLLVLLSFFPPAFASSPPNNFSILFSHERFPSGFSTGDCEVILEGSRVPNPARLPLDSQVRQLHAIAQTMFDSMLEQRVQSEFRAPPLSPKGLDHLGQRLSALGKKDTEALAPFSRELLVISNKMILLYSLTHQFNEGLRAKSLKFLEKIVELPHPREALDHALRALALGHAAVLRVSLLNADSDVEKEVSKSLWVLEDGLHEDLSGFVTGQTLIHAPVVITHVVSRIGYTPHERENLDEMLSRFVFGLGAFLDNLPHNGKRHQNAVAHLRELKHVPQVRLFPKTASAVADVVSRRRPSALH